MARKVIVVPHDPHWKVLFDIEASALRQVFGDQLVEIYHFGSTAIPGVCAKPIIDILITVQDIDAVDSLNSQLIRMGYTAQGEYGISGRRFFYKGLYEDRTHHLHVYQYDNPQILRHIVFRDYMRSHPMTAHQYAVLKERLAKEFPEDMESYIAGKNAFVKEQEAQALAWWAKQNNVKV